MPNDLIRQAKDLVPSPVGHGRETVAVGLILEAVAREIESYLKKTMVS